MDKVRVWQLRVARPSRAARGTQTLATAHRQCFDSQQVHDEATPTVPVNAGSLRCWAGENRRHRPFPNPGQRGRSQLSLFGLEAYNRALVNKSLISD